jgi:hypothetical protein
MTHGKAPYTKVAGDKPAGIDTSDQRDRPASAEPPDKPDRPVSPDPALATLLVVPWGEVVVNGRSRGVTPPLRQLDLPPGRHEIEIRNSTFPPHSQTVTVRAGQRITIRHRFDRS